MPESVHVEVTPTPDDPGSHDDGRIAALESRLQAAESRETPAADLSPVHEAIAALGSKFDALLDHITKASAGTSETTASVDDEDDDETEEAPKIVTQMATRAEIEEKPPRPAHFLFKRFGGR